MGKWSKPSLQVKAGCYEDVREENYQLTGAVRGILAFQDFEIRKYTLTTPTHSYSLYIEKQDSMVRFLSQICQDKPWSENHPSEERLTRWNDWTDDLKND